VRVDIDSEIFAGFNPLDQYVSPMMSSKVSSIRTKYTRNLLLQQQWEAFGRTTRSAAGIIALETGIPPWAVDGMRTLFSELRKVPPVADLVSEVLRGIPKIVGTSVLEAFAAVPYVRLVVNLGIATARLVQAAKGQAEKDRVPEERQLVYDRGEDTKSAQEVLLMVREGDFTTIFSPPLVGEWEEHPITWTLGGTNAQGRRFSLKRWMVDEHIGVGCLPGMSEQEGWYEYAFRVDAPWTLGVVSNFATPVTTLGSTHPSVRQLAATAWQMINKPSVQMFQLEPDLIIQRWEAYFASLCEFGLRSGGGTDTASTQLGFQAWKMCSVSEVHRLERHHPIGYPKSRFSGFSRRFLESVKDPDPMLRYKGIDGPYWPMTRVVRKLVERQKARMRPTLGTITCAYVPEDAPALREDSALASYHQEMRRLLLEHPARCDVELDLIPEGDSYRAAMDAAQRRISCGLGLRDLGNARPKVPLLKVDPDALPEPPPGEQGAPVPDAGDEGVMGALLVGLGLGIGAYMVFK
jgi:hypothetical protein